MILLDTHAWIWFVSNPELLSLKARNEIDRARNDKSILISAISILEIARLIQKKRLSLTLSLDEWVERSERLPFLSFVSIDQTIALKSLQLPEPLQSDAIDRIIIATAIEMAVPIVTQDEKISSYPHVKTVW